MRRFRLFFVFLLILLRVSAVFAEEHIVQKGETALQIALDHNLTMEQLQQLNPDVNLEMMMIGDKLTVPDENSGGFDAFLASRYTEKIALKNVNCELAADHSALCLFEVENLTELPLYDIRLKASLGGVEAEGGIGLMQLLPGETLPVYIGIPGSFGDVSGASVSVSALSWAEMMTADFRVPESAYTETDELLPDGAAGTAVIVFNGDAQEEYQDRKVNVLAAAYDADGNLVGVRSLYSNFYARLDITVYANARSIAALKTWLEVY